MRELDMADNIQILLVLVNLVLGAFVIYRFRHTRRSFRWLLLLGAYFLLRAVDRALFEILVVENQELVVGVDLLLLMSMLLILGGAQRLASALDALAERSDVGHAMNHAPDGIFLIDQDAVIRLWNPACAEITGVPAAAAIGSRIDEVVPEWEHLRHYVPLNEAGNPRIRRASSVPLTITGRELWLSIVGVKFEQGQVFVFRDRTAGRRLERLRADFVATASHELRTPLASVYGAVLTLQRPDVELTSEQRDELLSYIVHGCERLNYIVDDILLTSSIDAGRLVMHPGPVDIESLLRGLVEEYRQAHSTTHRVELELDDQLPLALADSDRLRQALNNLLENAIKYSPDGGTVMLGAHAAPATGRVDVFVRDQGKGIPIEEQDLIFDKFHRVDAGMASDPGGTGLGLYITKNIITQMNGTINVETAVGHGSTFHVGLPATPHELQAR